MTVGSYSVNRGTTVNRRRRICVVGWMLCLGMVAGVAFPRAGYAQFFRVYEYKTADAGAVEFSYWTTYVVDSDETINYFDEGVLSREKLWAHSFEVEYGLSHKLTVGFYADFMSPDDGNFEFIQSKLLARYRLFEKYELPVDIALYGEYIIPDKDYADSEKFEFRTVIEKDIGPWRVALNPILEKKTSGDDVEEGVEFAYAAGIYYDNGGDGLWNTTETHLRPGVEFYGDMGELSDPKGSSDRKHYIFPVIDLYCPRYGSTKFHWNFGTGFGLGGQADDLVLKSIVTFEFIF
ncbi:MAG: hypothetical protein JSW27_17325 [Phycisphaerales bacterium]|nr:MAG: hypothetical protein JSW27_17325 [Phycisphaerales bacterium]